MEEIYVIIAKVANPSQSTNFTKKKNVRNIIVIHAWRSFIQPIKIC